VKLSPYFVAITAFFVTALVIANVLAVKLVEIGDRVFPAGLVVAIKVVWEAAATPLTYLLVNTLKRLEGVDVYEDPLARATGSRSAAGRGRQP
jgi:hypothetical protein